MFRILKSLGELSFEHFKLPLILFFIDEIYNNNQLANQKNSLIEYWSESLRDPIELKMARESIAKYQNNLYPGSAVNEACAEVILVVFIFEFLNFCF